MTPTLFIRVPESPEAQTQWLRVDGAIVDGSLSAGDISEILPPGPGWEVVVVLPAAVVGLTEVDIPAQKRAQLLKAVPYALEDELAESVEGLHFAVRPRRNEQTLVAFVRRDWLAALLGRLEQQGLTPAAVVPEALCLPWQEGELTLLVEGGEAVLRTGKHAGFALDTDNLQPVFESVAVAETRDSTQRVRVYDRREGPRPALPLPPGSAIEDPDQAPVLALLAANCMAHRPINLLQGEFAPQSGWHRGWLQWRSAAILAAVVVVVHLIGIAVENRYLAHRRDALNVAMAEVYRTAFPDAVRIINPATQMRNRLAELREQNGVQAAGFMDLLAISGPTVMSDARVSIKLLRYRDGRMELDLDADTIERLEALQQRLRDAKLSAELKSVRNEGGRYLGRVVVGARSS